LSSVDPKALHVTMMPLRYAKSTSVGLVMEDRRDKGLG
jgi:hypothetical protein